MYYANEPVSYFELLGLGAFFNVKFTSKIDQNFILNSIFLVQTWHSILRVFFEY